MKLRAPLAQTTADVIQVSARLNYTENSQTLLIETDIDFAQYVLSLVVITTAFLNLLDQEI